MFISFQIKNNLQGKVATVWMLSVKQHSLFCSRGFESRSWWQLLFFYFFIFFPKGLCDSFAGETFNSLLCGYFKMTLIVYSVSLFNGFNIMSTAKLQIISHGLRPLQRWNGVLSGLTSRHPFSLISLYFPFLLLFPLLYSHPIPCLSPILFLSCLFISLPNKKEKTFRSLLT